MQPLAATSLALAVTLSIASAAHAGIVTVAEWNFNGASSSAVPGGGSSPTASTGTGTASLLGTTGSFASGNNGGGSSDPTVGQATNFGWQTTGYAAQGAGSGTRGVQFSVSTDGYENVVVEWDQRHSNTASRFVQFQYSLDGVSFLTEGLANAGIFEASNGGDLFYNNRSIDLGGIAGVADNASFAFRVVAVFAPSTSAYQASSTGSSYASTGTLRFDMVSVFGNVVPTPAAMTLLVAAGLVARRRR